MQIIKENKGNYEIYDLIEDVEKAKQYRAEMVKYLEFYRLTIDTWNYRGILLQILGNQEKEVKRVYELSKLPINENKFCYGNSFKGNKNSEYELSQYVLPVPIFDSDYKKIGPKQQNDFTEHLVEDGLSNYYYKQSYNLDYQNEHYIFLNSWFYSYNTKYNGSENVVHLPYEISAQYLLERPHLEAGFYFNRIENPKVQEQLLNTFDIDLSSALTQKQYKDLVKMRVINEEEFTRKLQLDSPISKRINKKR